MNRKIAQIAWLALIVSLLALPAFASTIPALDETQQRVRSQLVRLAYFGVFDNLEFQLQGSKVILTGQTVRPTLASDAQAAVERLEEVSEVENRIEVLPLSAHDSRLRRALFRSIYGNSRFIRFAGRSIAPIHIIVKNGHATLEGAVARQSDKIWAGILANQVSGVFSVTNNLALDS